MQLAEPALGRLRGLARVEERLRRPLERRLDPERRVDLLDGPLRLGETALRDAGHMPVLLRQRLAGVAVDAGDLEERDVGRTGVGVAARRLEQRRVEHGSERRRLGRERLRQAQVALGDEGRRVHLGVAGSDEDVLDEPADALRPRQPAEHRVAARQRERDLGEHEARDLLDEVDLAGDVAGAPGRDEEAPSPSRRSRAARGSPPAARPSRRGRSRRSSARGAAGSKRARAARRRRRCRPSSARRRARRSAASRARRPPRPPCGSTPFSHRFEASLRSACRSELRRIPTGSKFAASSRTDVVVSATSVSSPPMIPASAIARSPSAITRSSVVSVRSVPSSVRISSAAPGATDDDAAAERVEVERVQRAAEREHHVVRHVDDVRDRAHPGGAQPRLQPDRRRADPHVAEAPADVARAALEVVDANRDRLLAGVLRARSPGSGRSSPPSSAATSRATP